MTKYISLVDGSEYEMPIDATVTGWPYKPTPTVRCDEEIEGPKNIYWLFAGADYYPAGGINDFVGAFDTIQEAKDAFDALERYSHGWGHIVTVKEKGFTIVIETYDEIREGYKYYGWRRPS